eukprot:15466570-Alexandrium_andersonii.AAC.1
MVHAACLRRAHDLCPRVDANRPSAYTLGSARKAMRETTNGRIRSDTHIMLNGHPCGMLIGFV